MSVNYSLPVITQRLISVANTIDAGGGNANLILTAAGTTVSTVSLARPCGTVNADVLTFLGTLLDPAAANTGYVDGAKIVDSNGVVMVSGLTVGVPPHTNFDILISNGLNSTLITAGQTVSVLSAQITGS